MTKKVIQLIATFFNLGYLPLPGTAGSLAGLLIFFLISANYIIYLTVLVLLLILGFYVSGKSEEAFNQKDPRKIVIDEVCGMLIALFLLPVTFPVIISAFLLFRAFDAIKPPPANIFEQLSGGKGIMLDDIIAGIYTNLIIQLALKLTSA
ncbi:MAG: phosphatidylglycerophosphatase A [Candidatus Omnitrophota bacterium]